MRFCLLIFFTTVCLFGCKKNNLTPPSVAGLWELRNVINGSNSNDSTYQSGNGNVYQFNSDNTYAKFKYDTVLIVKGSYKVTAGDTKVANVNYNTITFDGNSATAQVVQVTNNTLTLGLTYNGGTAYLYAKVPQ